MKLYSVDRNELVEANVVRETPLYYFVDSSRLTGWSKRIDKRHVDLIGEYRMARVASTELGAWEIELKRAERARLKAKLELEHAIGDASVAQHAIDIIRAVKEAK